MPVSFAISTEIEASIEQVWAVVADVEQWPTWTSTMEWIKGLDGPKIELGRRFKVKQPRFAPAMYVVTELNEGHNFVWEARIPGLATRADHRLEANEFGTSVSLSFQYSGLFGLFFGALFSVMTKKYLQTEAIGLVRVFEPS